MHGNAIPATSQTPKPKISATRDWWNTLWCIYQMKHYESIKNNGKEEWLASWEKEHCIMVTGKGRKISLKQYVIITQIHTHKHTQIKTWQEARWKYIQKKKKRKYTQMLHHNAALRVIFLLFQIFHVVFWSWTWIWGKSACHCVQNIISYQ